MGEQIDHEVRHLAKTGEEALSLFRALRPEDWAATVYINRHNWTVKDVLAHLVFYEKALIEICKDVADGGDGAAEEFDQDRYNAMQLVKMQHYTPGELIEQFEQARAASIEWITTLDDVDLMLRGRHPTEGVQTLKRLIKLLRYHCAGHMEDVQMALAEVEEV